MPKLIHILAATLVLAALLGSIACSDDGDNDDADAVGGAESQFCGDVAALNTALATFNSLSASSSVDDAKADLASVKSALNDVVDSAKQLANAQVSQLEDSYDQLKTAVDDIPGDDTIDQALSSLVNDAAAVGAAQRQLARPATCP